VSAAELKRLTAQLNILRDAPFEPGGRSLAHFVSMEQQMTTLGYELNQGEWVLCTEFRDAILPMLHALAHARSTQYLKRLQVEMKG
jgi:hypothetical protein